MEQDPQDAQLKDQWHMTGQNEVSPNLELDLASCPTRPTDSGGAQIARRSPKASSPRPCNPVP